MAGSPKRLAAAAPAQQGEGAVSTLAQNVLPASPPPSGDVGACDKGDIAKTGTPSARPRCKGKKGKIVKNNDNEKTNMQAKEETKQIREGPCRSKEEAKDAPKVTSSEDPNEQAKGKCKLKTTMQPRDELKEASEDRLREVLKKFDSQMGRKAMRNVYLDKETDREEKEIYSEQLIDDQSRKELSSSAQELESPSDVYEELKLEIEKLLFRIPSMLDEVELSEEKCPSVEMGQWSEHSAKNIEEKTEEIEMVQTKQLVENGESETLVEYSEVRPPERDTKNLPEKFVSDTTEDSSKELPGKRLKDASVEKAKDYIEEARNIDPLAPTEEENENKTPIEQTKEKTEEVTTKKSEEKLKEVWTGIPKEEGKEPTEVAAKSSSGLLDESKGNISEVEMVATAAHSLPLTPSRQSAQPMLSKQTTQPKPSLPCAPETLPTPSPVFPLSTPSTFPAELASSQQDSDWDESAKREQGTEPRFLLVKRTRPFGEDYMGSPHGQEELGGSDGSVRGPARRCFPASAPSPRAREA